jgi:hypothetical protein
MLPPVNCVVSNFKPVFPHDVLDDNVVLAEFAVQETGPDWQVGVHSSVTYRVAFPPGVAAAGSDVQWFLYGAIGTVYRIASTATAMQWEESMVLPPPSTPAPSTYVLEDRFGARRAFGPPIGPPRPT